MMEPRQLIHQRLLSAFGSGTEVALGDAVFRELVQSVSNRRLTWSFFAKEAEKLGVKEVRPLLRVIQYFSGSELQLLKPGFEMSTEDGEIYVLTDEQVSAALNFKVNPLTGIEDPDLGQKLIAIFEPTDVARGMAK